MRAQQYGAYAGLAIGLAMALAANLTYAFPRGAVVVGIGLAAPLVLPLVLWLRVTFPATSWPRKLARELAMFLVATPAVAISYWHTYSLVLEAGEPWLIALIAPLSSDGVGAMATMALHWGRQREKTRKPVPSKSRVSRAEGNDLPPAPAPSEEVAALDNQRSAMTDRVAWLRARTPKRATDEINDLMEKFGISEATAHRTRSKAGRVAS